MRTVHATLLVLGLAALILLQACASMSPASPDNLKDRVETFWDAKQRMDTSALYDMHSDQYKAVIDKDQFLRSSPLPINSYTIKDLNIAPDGKSAEVVVQAQITHMGIPYDLPFHQQWIVEHGEWLVNPPPRAIPGSTPNPPAPPAPPKPQS